MGASKSGGALPLGVVAELMLKDGRTRSFDTKQNQSNGPRIEKLARDFRWFRAQFKPERKIKRCLKTRSRLSRKLVQSLVNWHASCVLKNWM